MSRFYGLNGVAELTPIESYDPRGKWTITRRWRGTPAKIQESIPLMVSAGVRFQIEEERPGGYKILSAVFGAEENQPANEPLADLWDLVGNDIEKSIWESPKVRAEMDKLWGFGTDAALAGMARLRADVESLARGETVTFDAQSGDQSGAPLTVSNFLTGLANLIPGPHPPNPSLDVDVFRKLIRSLSRGTESFVISQYVLRRRKIIAKNSTIKPSTVNINQIYTTTLDLTASEGVPTDLPFELPEGVWLKKTPTREQVAADKWQISQEWWHADSYDDLAYSVASQ